MHVKSQSGFTLIELAVVLTISALLMGGAIKMIEPFMAAAQRNTTEKKLNNIADALAFYAKVHGRLPCPGDPNPSVEPFGSPRNSGADGLDADNDCGPNEDDHVGIVPFRALGLEEGNALDGYDNLITYAVTPVLSGSDPSDAQQGTVHEMCRTELWIDPVSATNRNPVKAHLCCPRVILTSVDPMEISVMDGSGGGADNMFSGLHSQTPARYDDVDDVFGGVTPEPTNRLIAFVLLSHGDNGDGAYLPRAAGQVATTAASSTAEPENRDNDLRFISVPLARQAGTGYFDDIITWRTNDQLVSAFKNDSCARP